MVDPEAVLPVAGAVEDPAVVDPPEVVRPAAEVHAAVRAATVQLGGADRADHSGLTVHAPQDSGSHTRHC